MHTYSSLCDALQSLYGPDASVVSRRPVGGSDLNRVSRLTVETGAGIQLDLFLKENDKSLLSMFEAEATGLCALKATGAIGVPEVLAYGLDGDSSFLLLSWIASAPQASDYWEDFGVRLANMHRADTSGLCDGAFGFSGDNFIGRTPQVNTPKDTWVSFFRECRLFPQVRMAYDAGLLDVGDCRAADRVMERLDRFLIEPEYPSLLHGDLWGGNHMVGPAGHVLLIDPAVYVGHREADLAMTELFGGFHRDFYGAYREAAPLQPGYEDRRDLYNLYHLLNHLNLFGMSYYSSVKRLLNYYAG